MPQVNRFTKLPLALQREVEQRLVENGFSDYEQITDELQSLGYRISKSALHRMGQKLKLRFNKLQDEHLRRVAGLKGGETGR